MSSTLMASIWQRSTQASQADAGLLIHLGIVVGVDHLGRLVQGFQVFENTAAAAAAHADVHGFLLIARLEHQAGVDAFFDESSASFLSISRPSPFFS
jgi:hypothetical protein